MFGRSQSVGEGLKLGRGPLTQQASAPALPRTPPSSSSPNVSSSSLQKMDGPPDLENTVLVRISVNEDKTQLSKCMYFDKRESVWSAKQKVLVKLSKDLVDALNYGLYFPPANGRAGKFLVEDRMIGDYGLPGPVAELEFKYRRRVFANLPPGWEKYNPKMNTRAVLRKFIEYTSKRNVAKVTEYLSKGLDPNFQDEDSGETPMSVACVADDLEMITALIEGGAYTDFHCRDGLTPIHKVAVKGHPRAMKMLLDFGASPDTRDAEGLTPAYHCCVAGGSDRCLELLLRDRAQLNVMDKKGWAEIHQACRTGLPRHVDLLLLFGAIIDLPNETGNSALHVCCIYDQPDCAKALLIRGANKLMKNRAGQTPQQVAMISSSTKAALVLQSFNASQIIPLPDTPDYVERRRESIAAGWKTSARGGHSMEALRVSENAPSSRPISLETEQIVSVQPMPPPLSTPQKEPPAPPPRTTPTLSTKFPHPHSSTPSPSLPQNGGLPSTPQSESMCVATKRKVLITKGGSGFGFRLRGASNSTNDHASEGQVVQQVDEGGPAHSAGLRPNDRIVGVNGVDVTFYSHRKVVEEVLRSGESLELEVASLMPVTPQRKGSMPNTFTPPTYVPNPGSSLPLTTTTPTTPRKMVPNAPPQQSPSTPKQMLPTTRPPPPPQQPVPPPVQKQPSTIPPPPPQAPTPIYETPVPPPPKMKMPLNDETKPTHRARSKSISNPLGAGGIPPPPPPPPPPPLPGAFPGTPGAVRKSIVHDEEGTPIRQHSMGNLLSDLGSVKLKKREDTAADSNGDLARSLGDLPGATSLPASPAGGGRKQSNDNPMLAGLLDVRLKKTTKPPPESAPAPKDTTQPSNTPFVFELKKTGRQPSSPLESAPFPAPSQPPPVLPKLKETKSSLSVNNGNSKNNPPPDTEDGSKKMPPAPPPKRSQSMASSLANLKKEPPKSPPDDEGLKRVSVRGGKPLLWSSSTDQARIQALKAAQAVVENNRDVLLDNVAASAPLTHKKKGDEYATPQDAINDDDYAVPQKIINNGALYAVPQDTLKHANNNNSKAGSDYSVPQDSLNTYDVPQPPKKKAPPPPAPKPDNNNKNVGRNTPDDFFPPPPPISEDDGEWALPPPPPMLDFPPPPPPPVDYEDDDSLPPPPAFNMSSKTSSISPPVGNQTKKSSDDPPAPPSHDSDPPPIMSRKCTSARALFPFSARNEDELDFKLGDTIEIVQTPEGGWWEGRLGSKKGWFPSNHVQGLFDLSLLKDSTEAVKIAPPDEMILRRPSTSSGSSKASVHKPEKSDNKPSSDPKTPTTPASMNKTKEATREATRSPSPPPPPPPDMQPPSLPPMIPTSSHPKRTPSVSARIHIPPAPDRPAPTLTETPVQPKPIDTPKREKEASLPPPSPARLPPQQLQADPTYDTPPVTTILDSKIAPSSPVPPPPPEFEPSQPLYSTPTRPHKKEVDVVDLIPPPPSFLPPSVHSSAPSSPPAQPKQQPPLSTPLQLPATSSKEEKPKDENSENSSSGNVSTYQNAKPCPQWSTKEVGDWIDSIGLGQYRSIFEENDIMGSNLLELSKDDLKEMEITRLGHRMTISKEIDKLKETCC